MIAAFGPDATRFARGLGDLEAIVADLAAVGEAYAAAVRRRESGRPFYGMLLVDDPRVLFGYRHTEAILANIEDYDKRRVYMSQFALGALPINGAPARQIWPMDAFTEGIIVEFLALSDALLVRSFAEAARIDDIFARTFPRRLPPPMTRILAATSVPAVERVRPQRPGVVVWAPHRPAIETALHMHGLAEFHGDVTCVSAGGPLPSRTTARFVAPADPELGPALAAAAAVVCVEPGDPSDAVAFARLGYGVVAPLTSGAHEFAGNVVTWDALNARFLHSVVAVAVTRPAFVRSEPPRPPHAPRMPGRPAFVPPADVPLVSIVTPTFNRPGELRRMLSCIAAQTYPNIESVVVNDGGVAVADVVAEFPFARLIDLPENAGALRAVEVGRRDARGEYIALLPDDDWLYPDHVERLMNALLRSGAKIAHGAGLLRFMERDAAGDWQTVGFNNRTYSQTHGPSDALVMSNIAGHQMLVHRSVYDAAGGYLVDSDVADNEIHMRFTQQYFYAFANHVTAEFRDHAGGQGRRHDFPAALRDVYDRVHPQPNRPEINRVREGTIANIAAREPGKPPFPATLRIGRPPA
jgi:hypothetical protein